MFFNKNMNLTERLDIYTSFVKSLLEDGQILFGLSFFFLNDFILLKKCIPYYSIYKNIFIQDIKINIKENLYDMREILYCIKILKMKECLICLEQNCIYSRKLKCGHHFHPKCIDQWFRSKTTCPCCRTVVLERIDINFNERSQLYVNREQERIRESLIDYVRSTTGPDRFRAREIVSSRGELIIPNGLSAPYDGHFEEETTNYNLRHNDHRLLIQHFQRTAAFDEENFTRSSGSPVFNMESMRIRGRIQRTSYHETNSIERENQVIETDFDAEDIHVTPMNILSENNMDLLISSEQNIVGELDGNDNDIRQREYFNHLYNLDTLANSSNSYPDISSEELENHFNSQE